jgi:hypothetical protein
MFWKEDGMSTCFDMNNYNSYLNLLSQLDCQLLYLLLLYFRYRPFKRDTRFTMHDFIIDSDFLTL